MGTLLKLLVLQVVLVAGSWTNVPAERVLDVTWHHQEHNLSCEAAALKMALSYYRIDVDEMTLIGYMTNDRRPAELDDSGRLVRWGDPNAGFVGDPDGRIQLYQGYGVYFAPVARAAQLAGARVGVAGGGLYGSAVSPAAVYWAVRQGDPVVAWISNTYEQAPLSHYTTFDGKEVAYTLTDHAVTVIGVRADEVLINDPWFGQAWHPKAQFESAYRTFEDMAVVVTGAA